MRCAYHVQPTNIKITSNIRQQKMQQPCGCYSCVQNIEAPRSNDPWVNLISDMLRDGRLQHIGLDENGNNLYRVS